MRSKKPTVEAVQYVQTVQVAESFEGSENAYPSLVFSRRKSSKTSKPPWNNSAKSQRRVGGIAQRFVHLKKYL